VDTRQERPRWRTTLDYRITPRLQAGLEYNAVIGEIGVRGNWFLQTETDARPGIIAGTSSDRIGTPHGQAYFVTFSKVAVTGERGLGVAPYASVNYSEFDRGLNFPFGAAVALGPQWTLTPMYDGRRAHTTLTWSGQQDSVTLIWAFNRRFGLSVGRNF
jgi:hypothetical protein